MGIPFFGGTVEKDIAGALQRGDVKTVTSLEDKCISGLKHALFFLTRIRQRTARNLFDPVRNHARYAQDLRNIVRPAVVAARRGDVPFSRRADTTGAEHLKSLVSMTERMNELVKLTLAMLDNTANQAASRSREDVIGDLDYIGNRIQEMITLEERIATTERAEAVLLRMGQQEHAA